MHMLKYISFYRNNNIFCTYILLSNTEKLSDK